MKHKKHVEQQGTNTTQHTKFITANQKLEINTYSKELHHSESTHVESFVREHWTKIPVGRLPYPQQLSSSTARQQESAY